MTVSMRAFLIGLSYLFYQPLIAQQDCSPEKSYQYEADDVAYEALESTENMAVKKHNVCDSWTQYYFYTFLKVDADKDIGLIFLPGANVAPESYAPALRQIANSGYPVFLLPLAAIIPGQSASRIDKVIAEHAQIKRWYLAGHSFGGTEVSSYTRNHSDNIEGLIYWASYPSSFYRLNRLDLKVLSIYGTKDGITELSDIESSKRHLPAHTEFSSIEGGNHTQFGYYNDGELQRGDKQAEISRQDQQAEIERLSLDFLDRMNEQSPRWL